MNVSYVVDDEGKESAVIVPIGQWKEFLEKFSKMKNKLKVLTGLEEAVDEVDLIREGKKQSMTLNDFLDEN